MKKLLLFLVLAAAGMSSFAQNSLDKAISSSEFKFHWGVNNWGSSMLDGLSGMSDKAYDLRTSFSSYQLSYAYKFVNTQHVSTSIGVGYESDVYKFNTPCVSYSEALHSFYSISAFDNMKTKLCARYITLPLTFGWQPRGDKFAIKLSAIPGLNYSGKHTGLKQTLKKQMDKTQVGDLNPYKLDARIELDFGFVGLFMQVSTMSLMKNSFEKELYPLKFGIVL